MSQFAVVLEVRSCSPSARNWSVHDVMQSFSRFKVNCYQIFEVAPSLYMVDVRKVAGDTLEYHKVCSVCISSFILIILLGTVSPNEIYFSQPRPKGPSSLDPIDGQDHPRGLYLALSSNIDRFMNAHVWNLSNRHQRSTSSTFSPSILHALWFENLAIAATNLHPKLIAVLQELMQQAWQHNLEANWSFCEIHTSEDDHLLARHRHWWELHPEQRDFWLSMTWAAVKYGNALEDGISWWFLKLGVVMVPEAASAGDICTIAESLVDETRELAAPDDWIAGPSRGTCRRCGCTGPPFARGPQVSLTITEYLHAQVN